MVGNEGLSGAAQWRRDGFRHSEERDKRDELFASFTRLREWKGDMSWLWKAYGITFEFYSVTMAFSKTRSDSTSQLNKKQSHICHVKAMALLSLETPDRPSDHRDPPPRTAPLHHASPTS